MLQTRSSNSFYIFYHSWCLPHFLEPHVPDTLSLLLLFDFFTELVWRWSGLTFANCLACSALAKPTRRLISARLSDALNSCEHGNLPEFESQIVAVGETCSLCLSSWFPRLRLHHPHRDLSNETHPKPRAGQTKAILCHL